ncbi:unnamed protein product, partial [Staurois parvus]
TVGTKSPGTTVGCDSIGTTAGTGSSPQRASGHQASGHLACQRAPRHLARQWGSPVTRHWIVWLDSGHRVTRYDSGHWVTRHQVIWLSPAGTASSGKGSGHRVHQVRQRALSQLATTAGTGSGTQDHLDINSGHRSQL